MNKEEKKAIKNMKIFARSHENMSVVTAKEMDIVLRLVERLQKENELSKQALIENCSIANERNQLLKENEELRQERELVGLPVRNKRDGKIGIILHQGRSGSIAVLENIGPRVINTHDNWNTLEIINDNVKQKRTENNYISVQKVKDKIEEILNNGEYRIIFEGDAEFPDEATCIDAQKYIKLEKLQELLEGRK